MIIRSQDKTVITTDLNLRIFNSIETEEYKIISDAVGFIGTYSTEEKAIKVLDMICAFENGKEEDLLYPMEYDYLNSFRTKNVFIMPQDSEV